MASDRTPVIVEAALAATPCPLSLATLELFAAVLAAEAGNFALRGPRGRRGLSRRRLPRRLPPLLRRPGFLARMPLHVIVRPNIGLRGAIRLGLTLTDRGASPPLGLSRG